MVLLNNFQFANLRVMGGRAGQTQQPSKALLYVLEHSIKEECFIGLFSFPSTPFVSYINSTVLLLEGRWGYIGC